MEREVFSIEKFKACFEGILRLSRQQLDLLLQAGPDDDIDAQMTALRLSRQQLMREIDGMESKWAVLADPGFSGLESWREDILAIITEIQALDHKGAERAKALAQDHRKKLGQIKKSKVLYNAYVPLEIYSEGWFFDKKK